MPTLTYKCPSCAAPLIYEGREQVLQCNSCGNSFPVETVRQVNQIEQEDQQGSQTSWDMRDQQFSREEAARTKTYSCSSCGAELLTDETTVATNCAFCGSPSIMPAQFTPGTRPELIIPFIVKKQEAEDKFHGYFKGKKMLPNLFLQGRNQIDEIRQLYVPYWLFTCQADANMTYNATRVNTMRSGQYMVTTTQHYLVRRAGTLAFRELPIDASDKVDNDITETLEPYNTANAIQFVPETLSGAMANRANVSPEACKQRADQRISNTTESLFRRTVSGYNSVTTRSANIHIDNGTSMPVLFPIWLITTTREGKTYTFAINGQTGELTTNIPYSKGKFFGWTLGVAAGATAAGFVAATVLRSMGVM
ncbi:MAG: hypothetical protein GX653_02430 [Clostridiales bacterium]|nr:hypothetical protein [Clostridiales bacterium]